MPRRQGTLLGGRRHGDHRGAQQAADLDGGKDNAAGRPDDEQPLAGRQVCAIAQPMQRRHVIDAEARRLLELHADREAARTDAASAIACSANPPRTWAMTRSPTARPTTAPRRASTLEPDYLAARNMGQRRLDLIATERDQRVDIADAARRDLDADFRRRRLGHRQLDHAIRVD